MDFGGFESLLRNEQTIVENHTTYLKIDVAHMLESTINEIKGAEFSQVHQLSEYRRKLVDVKVSKLEKRTEILDELELDKVILHLLRLESVLWKKTSLKEYSEKDDSKVKEMLSYISKFHELYLKVFEKIVEYLDVLRNHGQLNLNNSFDENYTKADERLKIIFNLCRGALDKILKISNEELVNSRVNELLKYCNQLFSQKEKLLKSYRKTLEHRYRRM